VSAQPPIPVSEKIALRVSEACAVGGFGPTKLYELLKSGELKSVKRAGRRLILRRDLEAYLYGEQPEAA
jgi:excisionase family DNA binding protein